MTRTINTVPGTIESIVMHTALREYIAKREAQERQSTLDESGLRCAKVLLASVR